MIEKDHGKREPHRERKKVKQTFVFSEKHTFQSRLYLTLASEPMRITGYKIKQGEDWFLEMGFLGSCTAGDSKFFRWSHHRLWFTFCRRAPHTSPCTCPHGLLKTSVAMGKCTPCPPKAAFRSSSFQCTYNI